MEKRYLKKLLYSSAILILFFIGLVLWMRFGDKPSQRALGLSGTITHTVSFPFVGQNNSKINGMLAIEEIDRMIVLRFALAPQESSTRLGVSIYNGSCDMLGAKKYTIAPLKENTSMGWVTLYDISWTRLTNEMPLALTLEEDGVVACADIQL